MLSLFVIWAIQKPFLMGKKRPAAKKSPAARVTLVETFELDVVSGAPEAEGPELIHEEVDDDFAPDIGGSE